ncbi:MAG: hypothetical protein IPP50_10570 [Piscinibacter sp.]|nr:hypothetical protein [Piscinibacter sp.]
MQALALRHPCPAHAAGAPRLARASAARARRWRAGALGAEVAPSLYESELAFLHDEEWALCADDVLWRRSKLGLHYEEHHRAAVDDWCRRHWGNVASAPTEKAWN